MPILRATNSGNRLMNGEDALDGRDRDGGFTLLEMALTLVVIGLIAALGLPFSRPGAGSAALRNKAQAIVAILRSDRNAAIKTGRMTRVTLDADRGLVASSDRSDLVVVIPPMSLRGFGGLSAFEFYPNGRSSGGRLSISSNDLTYVVEVNSLTAAVGIAAGG